MNQSRKLIEPRGCKAICKSRNRESGNGMGGMMRMLEIGGGNAKNQRGNAGNQVGNMENQGENVENQVGNVGNQGWNARNQGGNAENDGGNEGNQRENLRLGMKLMSYNCEEG